MELKYCERCAGLWLRPQNADGVYCAPCHACLAGVTSYTMRNFEDVVIFVADMERAIEKLSPSEKKLLAMNVLEECTVPEVARLLRCNQRTAERLLQEALDQLSRILLAGGLSEELPSAR